jgi:hypothetical protein
MKQSKWKRPGPQEPRERVYQSQTYIHHPAPKLGVFRIDLSLKIIGILVLLAGLLYAVWTLSHLSFKQNLPLAVIEAESGPFKTRPEQDETLKIPHQEKTIYDNLEQSKDTSQKVEKIVQRPEEPLIKPPSLSENFFNAFIDQKPLTSKILTQETSHESSDKLPKKKHAFKIHKPLSTKIKGKGIQKSLESRFYHLQVSGYTSREEAKEAWKKLKDDESVKNFLARFEPQYQKFDLGAKRGIEYRINIGPFATEEEAFYLCSTLGPHCIVLAPSALSK